MLHRNLERTELYKGGPLHIAGIKKRLYPREVLWITSHENVETARNAGFLAVEVDNGFNFDTLK